MNDLLMRELREHFRERARPRIAEMETLIAALQRDARDVRALEKLARHFHALAGLGGTYGFPRVTQLADEGEGLTMPLARSAATPAADDVRHWSELVDAIAREIA